MTRRQARGVDQPAFAAGQRIPLPMSGAAVEVLEIGTCTRPACLCRDAAAAGIQTVHYREDPTSEACS